MHLLALQTLWGNGNLEYRFVIVKGVRRGLSHVVKFIAESSDGTKHNLVDDSLGGLGPTGVSSLRYAMADALLGSRPVTVCTPLHLESLVYRFDKSDILSYIRTLRIPRFTVSWATEDSINTLRNFFRYSIPDMIILGEMPAKTSTVRYGLRDVLQSWYERHMLSPNWNFQANLRVENVSPEEHSTFVEEIIKSIKDLTLVERWPAHQVFPVEWIPNRRPPMSKAREALNAEFRAKYQKDCQAE
jgi:hypothetical protein